MCDARCAAWGTCRVHIDYDFGTVILSCELRAARLALALAFVCCFLLRGFELPEVWRLVLFVSCILHTATAITLDAAYCVWVYVYVYDQIKHPRPTKLKLKVPLQLAINY